MRPLVEPHLRDLVPYVPGKPIEETEREFGIKDVAKLASNENCLGASPKALAAATAALGKAHLYPDAGGHYLKERLVRHHAAHGISSSHIVLGNGTNEIITLLARALLGEQDALLNAWPSFVVYRLAARGLGRPERAVPLTAEHEYDLEAMAEIAASDPTVKLVFLANPNNPTGTAFGRADLDAFFARVPDDVVVVLDEAYIEYVRRKDFPDGIAWAMRRPRTLVTRTFSKAYGLASLRIGYGVGDVEIIGLLEKLRDAFNTSSMAQAAAMAALDDVEHVARARAHNNVELPRLVTGLEQRGLDVTPSEANFVLAHLPADLRARGVDVPKLNDALLRRGVILRPVANYGLPHALRITVGTAAEDDKLLAALDEALAKIPSPSTGASRD